MALVEKYQPVIDLAKDLGVKNLQINESNGILRITGSASSNEVKQNLMREYDRIDRSMHSGELILDIDAPDDNLRTGKVPSVQAD